MKNPYEQFVKAEPAPASNLENPYAKFADNPYAKFAESAPNENTESSRTWGEAAKDTGAAVMGGFAGVAHGGAQVLDVANRVIHAPAVAANKLMDKVGIGDGNMAERRSEIAKAPGRAMAGVTGRARDHWGEQKSDHLKGKQELLASAREESDGLVDEFATTVKVAVQNPELIGDLLAESMPHMLLPAAAGRKAGSDAAMAVWQKGGGKEAATQAATNAAMKTGIIASGVSEGASAGAEARAEVMEMTPEQLIAGSRKYQSMIEGGASHEEAVEEIAFNAGLTAQAISTPLSMLAAVVTGGGKVEAEFFTGQGVKNFFGALGREFLQEMAQETGNEFGQNVGIQMHADSDQELTEGLGQAAALGGIAGAGQTTGMKLASGAVRAPGALADAVIRRTEPGSVEAELEGDVDLDAELADLMADLDARDAAVEQASILNTQNDLANYDVGLAPLENPTPGEAVYWVPEGGQQSLAQFEGIAGEMGGEQIASVVVDGRQELVPMSQLFAGEYQESSMGSPETGFGGPAEAFLPDDNSIPYEPVSVPAQESSLTLQQPGQETDGIDYTPPEQPSIDDRAQPVVDAVNENLRQQEDEATRQALESETAVPVRPAIDPAEQAGLYPPDPSAPRVGPAAERVDASGDVRLSRPEYRDRLATISSELEKGGGVAYIRDEHDRITGRTPSVNPDWFKSMNENPDTKMSVEDTRTAIDKALKGEKLGVRQLRVVGTALDAITEERGSYAREIRAMRENARQDRREAYEQWLEATNAPVDSEFESTVWPESPGEVYNETDYLPDYTMPERALLELADAADALGVPWESIDAALAATDTGAQTTALTQLVWDAQNEHKTKRNRDQAESREGRPAADKSTPGPLEETPTNQAQPAQAGAIEKPAPASTVKAEEAGPRKLQQHITQNTDTNPTEAQKEAGNYKKASVNVQGLDISIENPRGSKRSGVDPDGNAWEVTMHNHYGYIKRTEGADGEHVDVFVGPNPASEKVFIVDQVNPDGSFDEHKVLMGFDSKLKARSGYKSNYSNGWKVGPITSMTMGEFKVWLKDGNTRKPLKADHFADAGKKVAAPKSKTSGDSTKPDSGSDLRSQFPETTKFAEWALSKAEPQITTTEFDGKQYQEVSKHFNGNIGARGKRLKDELKTSSRVTLVNQERHHIVVQVDGNYVADRGKVRVSETVWTPVESVAKKSTKKQDEAADLPAILRTSKAQHLKKMAADEGIKRGSPGYDQAMAKIEERYESEVDRAQSGLTFEQFNDLNSDSPESVNRQAYNQLREEFGLPVETDSGAAFSLAADSDSNPAQPTSITTESAQRVIDRIQSTMKTEKTRINLVDSFTDLPATAQRMAVEQGHKTHKVRGAFYDGRVYVVRSAIKNEADAERVILHELYGHKGLKEMFGSEVRQAMGRLYLSVGGMKGVRDLAKKHNVNLDHYVRGLGKAVKDGHMDRDMAQSMLAEELLAHMAENNKPSVVRAVKEFIGAIRSWLRANGFSALAKMADTDLMYLLKQARQAVNEGQVTGQSGTYFDLAGMGEAAPAFSVDSLPRNARRVIGDDPVLAGWTMLAMNDEAFQLPVSKETGLVEIFSDLGEKGEGNYSGFTVYEAEELAMMNKHGAKKSWRVDAPKDQHGRRGKAAVYESGDSVWIDVSDLLQGEDGKRIYNAVANYAYNNDKVFIGDPDGLSPIAQTRRLENMISSALKFGTTRHLWPHENQQAGRKDQSVPPIIWKEDNDVHNLRQMLMASYESVAAQFPEIGDLVYNHQADQIEDSTGKEWTRDDFHKLASKKRLDVSRDSTKSGKPDARPKESNADRASGMVGDAGGPSRRIEITAGSATLERAVFTNTLLRRKGKALTELLANIGQIGSERLKQTLYSVEPEPRPSVGVSVSGVAQTETGSDVLFSLSNDQESGVVDSKRAFDNMPAIESHWKEFAKLRGFWDSASDVLKRHPKLKHVGDAVDRFFDQTRARMGMVNSVIDPAMSYVRKQNKKDRERSFRDFEAFVRHRENGRSDEAKAALAGASEGAKRLILAWNKVADISGTENQKVGVQVFDGKLNAWRPIGKLKEFFPRTYKPEVMEALAHPTKHPEVWASMAYELHSAGHIEANSIEQALEFMTAYENKYQDKTQQDYFAGIEKARGEQLPESLYDYSWDAAMSYKDRWAENVSRIEAFGQKSVDGKDVFDEAIGSTVDDKTRNYLGRVQERVYNVLPQDPYVRGAGTLNMLATAIQLGNPATALLNLIGGTALNFQAYGYRHSLSALGRELVSLGSTIKDARSRGILIDDYLSLMQDAQQQGVNQKVSWLTDKALKWGGYTPMEVFIRSHAMLTAKSMLNDAVSSWNKKIDSGKSLRYLAWYQNHGFDYKKLLSENGEGPETNRLLRYSVNLTQGSYKVNQTPVFVDSPIGRFLFKYQKFGTQLSRMFWMNNLKPFIDSIQKGGQTVQYTKDGKEYSARVRTFMPLLNFFTAAFGAGTALTFLRSALFGYNDPGPGLDELEKALEDDDTAMALALAGSRVFHSVMAVGATGFFGNYGQMLKDVADRQRVKSPIDPPALSPIKGVSELVLRTAEQKRLLPTARDMHEVAEQQLSYYRTMRRLSLKGLSYATDWDAATLEMRNRDKSYTRKMIRRYASETGLENKRRAPDRFGKTEMSAVNAKLVDAVMLGQPERAQAIMYDHLVKLKTPGDVDRALTSMRGAVRSAQPVRVSQSPSDRERRAFLDWVENRVGDENYQRIVQLDREYREAAIAAGLMTQESVRANVRADRRFEQGSREVTPQQLEAFLRRKRIRRPVED